MMDTSPRFLFDVGVGRAAELALRDAGYDVTAVRERDPCMPDSEILTWGASEGRIVVTMDRDFGELAVHFSKDHAGVLLLRMQDAGSEEKALAVKSIVEQFGPLLMGRFAVYQGGRLRLRPPP